MNIIGAALEQLTSESERLRDYLQNNIEGSGIDIPDEVWVPFTAALDFAEKASTSANTGSPKCLLCGSNSVETRTVRVCFNRSCHYIEASRPLRAGA